MMNALDGTDIGAFLAAQLADYETQWSLGTFGAIAEFARDDGEPATLHHADAGLSVVTARGGIRVTPQAGMRLFASESPTYAGWNHRISMCLPEDSAAMGRRRVLTELGPDTDALREQDRAAILFDLGLDALQVDACVRIADPQVAAALRPFVGRAVFEHDNPAMGIIVPANPNRVFISRVGRAEVYAPIPPAHGKSPDGPHTHVLPKLLHHKRTHAATEPVPNGMVPCAHLYPAHSLKDALGLPQPFNQSRYAAFQRLLSQFGDPESLDMKRRVATAVEQGGDPLEMTPDGRFGRATIRVALHQLHAAGAPLPHLVAWLKTHDGGAAVEMDDSEAHHTA